MIGNQLFNENLKKSEPRRFAAGQWLTGHEGYDITLSAMRCAPAEELWEGYVDGGDIWGVKDGARRLFEIKGPSRPFTSRDDWPYKDFIVEAKLSFDRKKTEPYMYIFVAPDLIHAARLEVKPSRAHWYVEERRGAKYPEGRLYYFTPLGWLTWFRLDEDRKDK